jgi:hypothetical protein
MSPSITTKAVSFGFAALVTLTIMVSLDALATTEQSNALQARGSATQTACVAPAARG